MLSGSDDALTKTLGKDDSTRSKRQKVLECSVAAISSSREENSAGWAEEKENAAVEPGAKKCGEREKTGRPIFFPTQQRCNPCINEEKRCSTLTKLGRRASLLFLGQMKRGWLVLTGTEMKSSTANVHKGQSHTHGVRGELHLRGLVAQVSLVQVESLRPFSPPRRR